VPFLTTIPETPEGHKIVISIIEDYERREGECLRGFFIFKRPGNFRAKPG
jgi:hypothetical protein